MNRRNHVVNAALLSAGLAIMLASTFDVMTLSVMLQIGVPVMVGALFPDLDVAIGAHRKTFHNLPVLSAFMLYPVVFDNLHFIWMGILAHYLLDLLGTDRGIALLYPLQAEIDVPLGVPVGTRWADLMTLLVTGFELWVLSVLLDLEIARDVVTELIYVL